MVILSCIGISKIYDIENYLEATQNAIEDYLKQGNINNVSSMIIIIKSYDHLNLNKVNKVFELVQGELNCEEISCNMKEVEEKILKDKIEIILVGV